MKAYFLTTDDNPFDPADEFEKWYLFDVTRGHDCCGKIERICGASSKMTDAEYQRCVNAAVDEICRLYGTPYRRIVKDL